MDRTKLCAFVVIAAAAVSGGCLERELISLNPCLVSGVVDQIEVSSIEKVDLLFVVDNSSSMIAEQDALKQQFPKLIETLTSGVRSDGTMFPPVKSLHLGVVSTDMGLVGVANATQFMCDPNGGDDGLLQHDGGRPGCKPSYPSFLSFELGTSSSSETAMDFACIATLGTGGCGFEQPLESALKALWPKQYVDQFGNAYAKNPISFVATSEERTYGHGDVSLTQGGNAGFLRNDANDQSLIAIVLVTDEEDCSSIKLSHFTTDRNDPISKEPVNLRCFNHKENLFKVQRYIEGYKALRPGNENLVIFAAITGVPIDLVDAAQRARFNELKDVDSREAYYDALLNDERMQEKPNGETGGAANLVPSCRGGKDADAYPPRRIVEVARGFGDNGIVQSICQADFGPAMEAIIRVIIDKLPSVCLPKPLVRTSKGTVDCNVVWELPPAAQASSSTPTECEGPGGFLEPVDANRAQKNDRGGNNCKVRQLPVSGDRVPEGKGWYYDNFGPELQNVCKDHPQRVAFTDSAKPGNGVVVKLECINETQSLRSSDTRRMPDQPNIGTPCRDVVNASGQSVAPDDVCVVQMKDGTQDRGMFCHGDLNVCTRACQGVSDCPPAWVCDDRPESLEKSGGRAFCVNPTCGSE